MPEEFYDREFPSLRSEGWRRTNEPANYNCIAFAAGDATRYWWPNLFEPEPSDSYWPASVPNHETLDAFIQAFAAHGFLLCEDDAVEPGFDKIALYSLSGLVKHAALQWPNGKWRSKLGPHEDIETTLQGLCGPAYGSVAQFMKRPQSS